MKVVTTPVSARELRSSLRAVLDRAHVHGETVPITRHGETIAYVVPAGQWCDMAAAHKLMTQYAGLTTEEIAAAVLRGSG